MADLSFWLVFYRLKIMTKNSNRERVFHFKQFSVKNELSGMKVGTDGVLLGAWADVAKAKNALDIGSGTGLLSLMLAQRNSDLRITGVEIDPLAYEEALENVKNSPWADRIQILNQDFLSFETEEKFDLIISNPPFYEGALVAPDAQRSLARSADVLPLESFFTKAISMLSKNGSLAFIYPISALRKINRLADKSEFFCKRYTYVTGREDLPLKRVLCQVKNGSPVVTADFLAIEVQRHKYTQKYIDLVKDFYLKM